MVARHRLSWDRQQRFPVHRCRFRFSVLVLLCGYLGAAAWAQTTSAARSQSAKVPFAEGVETCLRTYPELLARVEKDLRPWIEQGHITKASIDATWGDTAEYKAFLASLANKRCGGKGGVKRLCHGLKVRILHNTIATEYSGNEPGNWRVHSFMRSLELMTKRYSDIPDVDLVISLADKISQVLSLPPGVYNDSAMSTFDPALAPLHVMFRRVKDTATVLMPDMTILGGYPAYPARIEPLEKAAELIRRGSRNHTWDTRTAKLFFSGAVHSAVRLEALNLAFQNPTSWGVLHMSHNNRPSIPASVPNKEDFIITNTRIEDHCSYKYLVDLVGNAASFRTKYLFFCSSVVVVVAKGGSDAPVSNPFEQYFYHRLIDGVNSFRTPTPQELPSLVRRLQENDAYARQVAEAGTRWANRELSNDATMCYFARLIQVQSQLQRNALL